MERKQQEQEERSRKKKSKESRTCSFNNMLSTAFFCLNSAWLNVSVVRAVALLSATKELKLSLFIGYQKNQRKATTNQTTTQTNYNADYQRVQGGRLWVACSTVNQSRASGRKPTACMLIVPERRRSLWIGRRDKSAILENRQLWS